MGFSAVGGPTLFSGARDSSFLNLLCGLLCPRAWSMTEEENIEGLAAEYVLGSLDEAERKEANVRRRTDTSLARAIEAWERRLGPLSEDAPSVEPPSYLLIGILARIPEQRRSIRSAEVVPLRAAARSWQSRAIGATALRHL